jgi:hypothetical protein
MNRSPQLRDVMVAVILSCATTGFGQSAEQALRFSARPIVGFCTSQVHGDQVSGFDKFGWTAGAVLDIRRGAFKGIQGGLIWTQKGSRRPPNPKNLDYTTWRYQFTYFDIPLLRVWNPNPTVWWFAAGIQTSILVKAEEDFFGTYDELSFDLNPFDVSGILAAGYEVTDHLGLEVRVGQSLLPISPQPEQPVQGRIDYMMNMTIQWMATWQL